MEDLWRCRTERKMREKKYRTEYDLVRVLAMICVVVFHFNVGLSEFGIHSSVMPCNAGVNLTFGQQGVVLFFILSGAVSCISYEKCLKGSGKQGIRGALAAYYKKRFWAIVPMFWIAYFIAYVLVYVPHGGGIGKNFIFTVLGLDGYLMMHGIETSYQVGEWFMGAILILYLLFPALYHLIGKWPKRTMTVLTVFFILCTEFFPFESPKETWVLLRIFDFAIGICFGLYIKSVAWKTVFVSLAVLAVTLFVELPADNMYAVILQGVALFIVLYRIGQYISKSEKTVYVFLQKGLRKISKYTYAVFLVHHLIINRALPPFSGQGWNLAVYVGKFVYVVFLIAVSAVLLQGAAEYVISHMQIHRIAA